MQNMESLEGHPYLKHCCPLLFSSADMVHQVVVVYAMSEILESKETGFPFILEDVSPLIVKASPVLNFG